MLFPRYSLLLYDTSKKNKCWYMLNHHFIIEKNNNNQVSGTFLRDIWFNYEIPEKDELYFMIILIHNENHYNKIMTIIENTTELNENGIPTVNNIPIQSSFSKCFILTKNIIKNTKEKMNKNNKNTEQITLFQDNCYFIINIITYDNKFMVTLPRFELN